MEQIRNQNKDYMDSSTNHTAPVLLPKVYQNGKVDNIKKADIHNPMDATIFTSPIPQACSTSRKGKSKEFMENNDLIPVRDSEQKSIDTSLGLLRLSEMSEANRSQLLTNREQLHSLALKTLERRHSKYGKQAPVGLPSNLFEQTKERSFYTPPPINDSTISESDFSNPQIMPRFTPSARSSSLSGSSFIEEERMRLNMMSECLKDPEVDVSALIKKYLEESQNVSLSIQKPDLVENAQEISINSDDFVSGENALCKLQADERSWYREKMSQIPPSTNFSVEENFDGAQSIGEFFWKKTEPLTNLSLQTSPEKRYKPVALIDETSSNISSSQDTRSVTQLLEKEVEATRKWERDSIVTLSMIKRALPHLQLDDSPRAVLKTIPEQFKKPKAVPPLDDKSHNNETVKKDNRSSMISSNLSKFGQTIQEPSVFKTFPRQQVPKENKENSINSKDDENDILQRKRANEILVDSSNLPESIKLPLEISPNISETGSLSSEACSELELIEQTESSPCPTPALQTSSRSWSTGSVQSLAGGKLPIESTRTEVVWECIKIGKTSMQEFVLRNRATLRLRLCISVTGSAFKIHKSGQEFVDSLSIVLHSLESRTITVAFTPSSKGAYCEKLTFSFNEREAVDCKRQTIYCFGYGGNSNVDVVNITKDSGGRMWMLLGQVGQRAPLRCKFTIRNSGNLAAFMAIQLSSKMMYHLNDFNSELTVEPMQCVLQPKEERNVTVTLLVKNEDYRSFYDHCRSGNVVDVGYFSINTGAEATRARLRRLFKKQRSQNIYNNIFKYLDVQYPGESVPEDVKSLRETNTSMKRLLKGLVRREISVTVEMDPDMTLMAPMNDTCMFRSLCGETTLFSKQNETVEEHTKEK